MIVDDDVFVLAELAELLSEDGYDVHTASNGFSAVRQARELRPSVVLLDLMLPERSGNDVLDDLRTDPATRDGAVVVVTGHADALADRHLSNADGVVIKPFDIDDLLATVQRAVIRAAARRAEVAPIVAVAHRESTVHSRRPAGATQTRGRR